MGKFFFNHLSTPYSELTAPSLWERWIGNVFVLCLMGSMFVQPKPTLVIMCLSVFMLLSLLASPAGRVALKQSFSKESYLITMALLLWFLVHLFSVLVHQPVVFRQLGNYAKALFAIGVLVFLIRAKPSLNYFFIGTGIACIAALLHSLKDRLVDHHPRAVGWFNNDIHFGDYSSLAGVFAILSGVLAIDLKLKWRIMLVCLGALGFAAAAVSGTRSALLAIVCLAPLVLVSSKDLAQRYLRWSLIAVILASSLAVVTSPRLQRQLRLSEAIADIEGISAGKGQSSIADRLEMWKASVNMAKKAPILGIGMANFEAEMKEQIDTQQIRPLLSKQNQAHSQIFQSVATGGVLLLIAYFLFVLVPLAWFWQLYRRHSHDIRLQLIAQLGMAHIGGHFIFGLTAAIFDIQVFSTFYVMGLATFAALCINRQRELALSPGQVV